MRAVINKMSLKFESHSVNEAFARQAVGAFASQLDPTMEELGDIKTVVSEAVTNAIVHGYADRSGFITVAVRLFEGRALEIKIKDTGCGIPKASITKIWERFYKLDASRGKDRKGTGLGLSIVKEIITAHNQNINVISTEGVGTEFIFTLAKGEAPK